MTPASLVHFQPELLHRYVGEAPPAGPCGAPAERWWAGLAACVVLFGMAPLLIALSA